MFYERSLLGDIESYRDSPESLIVTGMRRTGKTSLMREIYQRTPSTNKLYLDLENPLNRRYWEEENYESIKKTLEVLGLSFRERAFIFLDEIQFSPSLPSVVKYFIDHYGTKFYLTGSASFYLKNLFTESLAGRKYLFELYPLTFKEFLHFKGSSLQVPQKAEGLPKTVFDTLSPLYEEYLRYGGFPSVVLKESVAEKKRNLEDIFSSYFQLEVLQLGDFRRNDVIRDLILLLLERIGSKVDVQKLSRELKVSRPTINEYLSFLESTYFIKLIRPYSQGRGTEIRKAPKVYLCDTGLANNLARPAMGHLFENAVFNNLFVKGTVNYYQRKSGDEIDFILKGEEGFEVKLNPTERDHRKLKKLAKELSLKKSRIISRDYSELEGVLYGFAL